MPATTSELWQRRPGRVDRRIAQLPPRLRWATGALRLTIREPADGLDRALIRAKLLVANQRPPGHQYHVEVAWHRRLHERLGIAWPCAAISSFDRLWSELLEEVRAHGLSLGRGTYGGWDDADSALARAIWCLMSHLHPAKVIETGVARGVTSRCILEALARAGTGHLWSIDLPAMDATLHDQIGIAVPDGLRRRWTYISGTSRKRLPTLLDQVGPIDLFIHDSSHTKRNLLFELQHAWDAMERGAIVADDIDQSAAFAEFACQLPPGSTFVVEADDGSALFGIALKGV
ncbi:MAG: class I SAM-dependent methyltransferase [Solirubrobacterales bacterium]|nr:class I SAM-dependent methyltransferase [Solirubrobacterales bacterium]